MSSLTVYAPKITILDNVVNAIDGLYSLNDLHKASGNEKKHQPAFFMRNKETKELVEELKSEYFRSANMQIKEPVRAVKGVQGNGAPQGTYVCKELVYRYAMWISAKFALVVIRTFDALVTRTDAKQREALVAACDKLAIGNTLRSDVYTMVANHFGYEKVTQIPAPLLPEAVAFTYEMMLARRKPSNAKNYATLETNSHALSVHMVYCKEWFDSVRVALEVLNPEVTRRIAGQFDEGWSAAKLVNWSLYNM